MSDMNSNNRLELISQKIEDVIGDSENNSCLIYNSARSGSNASTSGINTYTSGVNTSDFIMGSRHQMIPELEGNVIRGDFGDTDEDEDSFKTTQIPNRQRDILNFSNENKFVNYKQDELYEQMKSENEILKNSLRNTENELNKMKKERDNLAIKFNAINEKFNLSLSVDNNIDQRLWMSSEDLSRIDSMSSINIELRNQLDHDNRDYKRKLAIQHKQQLKNSELIRKLQNKCQSATVNINRRLEMAETNLKSSENNNKNINLVSLLTDLKDEQSKSHNLIQATGLLRKQLEEATNANIKLTEDLGKLTEELEFLKKELNKKEISWRDDEAIFSKYFINEQNKIQSLWNTIVNFKRQFQDIRSSNEWELHQMKVIMDQTNKSLQLVCSNFDVNNDKNFGQLKLQLKAEEKNSSQLKDLLIKMKEECRIMEKQFQKKIGSLNEQLDDINKTKDNLKKELSDKDKILSILQKLRNGMNGDLDTSIYNSEDPATRQLIIDTDATHQALRDIAQMVMDEDDQIDSHWMEDDFLEEIKMNNEQYKSTPSVNLLSSNRNVGVVRSPKVNQFNSGSLEQRNQLFHSKSPVSIADSTSSAVRSVLQKRTFQIQDLISKINIMKTNLFNVNKHLEDSENERRNLEKQFLDLRNNYDCQHRELDQIKHECQRMQNTITMMEEDKMKSNKAHSNAYEECKMHRQEMEKLKAINYGLQQEKENIYDNFQEMERNLERQTKKVERLMVSFENSDSKTIRLKEEITSAKESLTRALLEKEVLEKQNSLTMETLSNSEALKADLELRLNKLQIQEDNLREKFDNIESMNQILVKENAEFKIIIDEKESEKLRLSSEKKALEQEKFGIREELKRVENQKEELNQMKFGLHQSIQSVGQSYENLKDELAKLKSENLQLENINDTLKRDQNALSAELLLSRKDSEKLSTALQMSMQDKDVLSNENMKLISQLNSYERELGENANVVYSLQVEKEELDGQLYASQQLIAQLQAKMETITSDVQQLERRRSVLFDEKHQMQNEYEVELQKIMKAKDNFELKLNEKEKEWNKILRSEKRVLEEEVERLGAERDELRNEFRKYKESMEVRFQQEIDELQHQLNRDKKELTEEIITIQRKRDDILLESEMNKQHAINVLEQEKISLSERISKLTESLKGTEAELVRTRNECENRTQQDQNIIKTINKDLKTFRLQFETINLDHDREIKELQNFNKDLENQRFLDERELEKLRSLLEIAEEAKNNLRHELTECMKRVRDVDDQKELFRRDLHNEKKNVLEGRKELEVLELSNKEIRDKLKASEIEKIDLQRQLHEYQYNYKVADEQRLFLQKESMEYKSNLKAADKDRLAACRELEEMKHQVRQLFEERGKLVDEVDGLQERISVDGGKEMETRREHSDLKQKVRELESEKEDLANQLNNMVRKADDLENLSNAKENTFKQYCDKMLNDYKKVDEIRIDLENQMEVSNHVSDELRADLYKKEAIFNDLERKFSVVDQMRKNSENRLATIHSHLRKLIGFRQQASPAFLNMSPSPERQCRSISPFKGRMSSMNSSEFNNFPDDRKRFGKPDEINHFTESIIPGSDLEPEAVRLALTDIVQHIAKIEKERNDMEGKAKNAICKSDETSVQLNEALKRINHLQSNFGNVEQDKKGTDSRFESAQTALLLQEETIQRNERERQTLTDRISKFEKRLIQVETEKQSIQEKLDKMRIADSYHDEERKCLIRAVDDAENRCTQTELLRRGLEGELQRMKMGFSEKETENRILKDRIESLTRQITDLESKAQTLQLTINRLSANLARAEEQENKEKDKVHQLNLSLSEHQVELQNMHIKLEQIQSILTSSENDRKNLQERLEAMKNKLAESKSHSHSLLDRIALVQQELTDTVSSKSELETEIKILSQNLSKRQELEHDLQSKLQRATMEKVALTKKLSALTVSFSGLESERKDMEKVHLKAENEKKSLKKAFDKLEKEKNQSEQYANQSLIQRTEMDETTHRLKEENEVLHRQIQKLQNQITDAERNQTQRMMELSSHIKNDMISEIEKLRSALKSAEKTLHFREKSHNQRVISLEEQLSLLKDQLSQELKNQEFCFKKPAQNNRNGLCPVKSILDRNIKNISSNSGLQSLHNSELRLNNISSPDAYRVHNHSVASKPFQRSINHLKNNSFSCQNLSNVTRVNQIINDNRQMS